MPFPVPSISQVTIPLFFGSLQPRMNNYPEENLPDDNRCQTIKHFPDSQSRAPAAHRRQSIPVCGSQADSCPMGMTSSISSPGLLTARYSDLGKCLTCPKAWKRNCFQSQLFPVDNILKQADHKVKFSVFHVWFLLEPLPRGGNVLPEMRTLSQAVH